MASDDKLTAIIEQYDINIFQTYRFGGALFLETDKGFLMLRQRKVCENRIIFENDVKNLLISQKDIGIDTFIKNKEDRFVTEGIYRETYVLRHWYQGRECDLQSSEDLCRGAKALGMLHRSMWGYTPSERIVTDNTPYYMKEGTLLSWEKENLETETPSVETSSVDNSCSSDAPDIKPLTNINSKSSYQSGDSLEYKKIYLVTESPYIAPSVTDTFKRRITEMKRIITYLKKQKRPSPFESVLKRLMPEYLEKAYAAKDFLNQSHDTTLCEDAITFGSVFHGCYTGHNIIFSDVASNVVNFDKSRIGPQINDLYHFVRKAGEKNNWDIKICLPVIESYRLENDIDPREINILLSRLLFPEKFWKTVNMYFNGKKNWIPGRVEEKLTSVCALNEAREAAVKDLISYYLG